MGQNLFLYKILIVDHLKEYLIPRLKFLWRGLDMSLRSFWILHVNLFMLVINVFYLIPVRYFVDSIYFYYLHGNENMIFFRNWIWKKTTFSRIFLLVPFSSNLLDSFRQKLHRRLIRNVYQISRCSTCKQVNRDKNHNPSRVF